MTESTKPDPSVAVIMLTYNQQSYVAEALNAVLAQDYEPLEVVICDDASLDESFAIMERIVDGYDGPHHVTLHRQDENKGYVGNLMSAVSRTTAEIMIPAYGDDISLPFRVREIVNAFQTTNALLVFSDAFSIGPNGEDVADDFRKATFLKSTDPLDAATSMSMYLGASGGWHRDLFDKYGPLGDPSLFDDLVLGFRAALEGRVAYIDQQLLKYRSGIGLSYAHASDAKRTSTHNEQRRRKILGQRAAAFRQRLKDAKLFGLKDDDPIVQRLLKALKQAELRLDFYEFGVFMIFRNLGTPFAALAALMSEGLRAMRRR